MDKTDIILGALSAGGENAQYTPVQIQKLFFLIDREASHLFEGPHFDFQPYDYGPFDKNVYNQLDQLAIDGLARTSKPSGYRLYSLTAHGHETGQAIVSNLDTSSQKYLTKISTWVRELSFEQLVASIYKRYPDMKERSVFQG